MVKRGLLILFLLVFGILFFNLIYAQENDSSVDEVDEGVSDVVSEGVEPSEISDEESIREETEVTAEAEAETPDILEEVREEFQDAELKESAGITPDSPIYFVEDSILTKFRDDLGNREKKIAEIKAMVEEGKIDEAKEALQRYEGYAENLEKEVAPEKREEARRSAAAIRNTLDDIENEIPEEDREVFIENILEKESGILTAAEIASKIKDLCETLSKLDPLEYSRVCKIEGDAPRWQRNLHRELTKEQEEEAKKFFEVMSECFESSGRECKCEEIQISAFAERCSIMAPLAVACDEGDEDACNEMEEIEQDSPTEELLPDYLQDIFLDIQGGMDKARYGNFMPPECVEAGVTSPEDCMTVMFEIHAPEECVQALREGKINPRNEKEAREVCDKIMFEANAPEECIDAGITNPKECGRLMFKLHAAPECIKAGLTGENRGDEKKCREIMEKLGPRGREMNCPPGEHPGTNDRGEFSCIRGQSSVFGGGNCRGIQDPEERLRCYDSASQGARVEYEERQFVEERVERVEGEEFRQPYPGEEFREGEGPYPPEGEFAPPPEGEFREGYEIPPEGEGSFESGSGEFSGGGEPSPESSSGGESSGGSSESGGDSGITGGVIGIKNRFLGYWFRW